MHAGWLARKTLINEVDLIDKKGGDITNNYI